jgi:hypothetical protein
MTAHIDFNLNDYVQVRLNDLGRKIHREDFDDWTSRVTVPIEYRAPIEDAEGLSKWQLWSLMELYGPFVGLGKQMPFEIAIQFPVPTRPQSA